jgi:hypothetical protein
VAVAGPVPGVLPAVAAGLLALAASSGWLAVLKALHGVPFGVADPMLGRDVAFYAFTLPVLSGALALCVALTLFALLLVGAFYVLSGAVAVSGVTSTARDGSPVLLPPQLRVSRAAGSHVAALVALYLVLTALQLWLVDTPGCSSRPRGPLVGASYTDVHARLPGLRIGAAAALLAAAAVIVGVVRGRTLKYTAAAIAAYAVVSLPRARRVPGRAAEAGGGAHRAHEGAAVPGAAHRGDAARLGPRQRDDGATCGARRRSPSPTSRRTPRRSRTCDCGTAAPSCRPSGRSRRSGRTTTSCRSTTTATGSTGGTARCSSPRAS